MTFLEKELRLKDQPEIKRKSQRKRRMFQMKRFRSETEVKAAD